MKFKKNLTLASGLENINIVAFINVILLLLTFFIFSSSITHQTGINVKLPKAVTSDVLKEENLIITITSENVIYLNSDVVTLKEVAQELKKLNNKKMTLLIKADRRASMGRIVDVWDLCRSTGIDKINITTDQEK